MSRPWAYVTAAWGSDKYEAKKKAIKYCRRIAEAGYDPICPIFLTDAVMDDTVPVEYKHKKDYAEEHLKRSRILVVCGGRTDAQVKSDIALARRMHIAATTLQGIEEIDLKCPKKE